MSEHEFPQEMLDYAMYLRRERDRAKDMKQDVYKDSVIPNYNGIDVRIFRDGSLFWSKGDTE